LIESVFSGPDLSRRSCGGRVARVFVFRCPNTGFNVQGWVANDPAEGKAEVYESIACTICRQVHLVSPRTGKVLGTNKDYS
jgi:hypothetical protein